MESLTAPDGFARTSWRLVIAADADDGARREAALERLCRGYWQPVFLYARRRGLAPHDAEDATQGFFAQILDRDWFKSVDHERGSFRGFLLSSFRFFLSNEHPKKLCRQTWRPQRLPAARLCLDRIPRRRGATSRT